VVSRINGRHLIAQIHREPDRIAPTMIASTPLTKFVLLLSGSLYLNVFKDGRPCCRDYHALPGSLCLSPPHRPDYELEYRNESPQPMRTLHLYLHDGLLAQTAAADADLDAARLELPEDHILDDPLIVQLVSNIAREIGQPEARNDLYADTAARMLAIQLVRRHGVTRELKRKTRGAALSPGCLRKLGEYVREHLHRSITLDELAAVASLSPYHFCRAFQRTTGQSPNRYVIAQRMGRAAHLLRSTHLTVTHVASEVGYESVSHFSELFKRHTGYSPGTYVRHRLL
jgi:AraC family transcriptional regulator